VQSHLPRRRFIETITQNDVWLDWIVRHCTLSGIWSGHTLKNSLPFGEKGEYDGIQDNLYRIGNSELGPVLTGRRTSFGIDFGKPQVGYVAERTSAIREIQGSRWAEMPSVGHSWIQSLTISEMVESVEEIIQTINRQGK